METKTKYFSGSVEIATPKGDYGNNIDFIFKVDKLNADLMIDLQENDLMLCEAIKPDTHLLTDDMVLLNRLKGNTKILAIYHKIIKPYPITTNNETLNKKYYLTNGGMTTNNKDNEQYEIIAKVKGLYRLYT